MSQIDFSVFAKRAASAQDVDPRRVARAGLNLIEGALRIRRGEVPSSRNVNPNDVLGSWLEQNQRPVTKPAEAVGAWLKSLESDLDSGEPFLRPAEMREAVIAAGEEVDAATQAAPSTGRLRSALYSDALSAIGSNSPSSVFKSPAFPWVVAGILGGILVGIFVARRK